MTVEYKTLRPGHGRSALKVGIHRAPADRILVIYGGNGTPVDGFQRRFRTIGTMLAGAGHAAVVQSSDPFGSSKELGVVLDYIDSHAVDICGSATPQIYLAGHSAGASAAAKIASRRNISRLLLIAPSAERDLGGFTGELYAMVGSRDGGCLAATRSAYESASAAQSRRFVTVSGADHVFHSKRQNQEYMDAFLWMAGVNPTFDVRPGRVTRQILAPGVEVVVHPAQSDRVLMIYGARDTKIDGWKRRYHHIGRRFAKQQEAAVVQVAHNQSGVNGLRCALEFVRANATALCGNPAPSLMLMGHAGGAVGAAEVAGDGGVDRLLLIAPTDTRDLQNFDGDLYVVGGEQDLRSIHCGVAICGSASAAAKRELAVVPGADRAFHTPPAIPAFDDAFEWAAGTNDGFRAQHTAAARQAVGLF